MMAIVTVFCIMAGCMLLTEEVHSTMISYTENPLENDELTIFREANDKKQSEDETNPERTWKMSKKNVSYAIIAVILKALLLIKLALAKLAVLGNVSIMLSKLSLILSLVLTLGKYFGGISKILKLRASGYEGHSSYQYPGHADHGVYVT